MEAVDVNVFIKEILEKMNEPEEIAKREAFLAEKRKSFILSIRNGDHFGSFYYQMIFKEETSRGEFLDIMEKAETSDNCYSDLWDQPFKDAHGILDVEFIKPDFQGYIEEYRLLHPYNSETGEPEGDGENGC